MKTLLMGLLVCLVGCQETRSQASRTHAVQRHGFVTGKVIKIESNIPAVDLEQITDVVLRNKVKSLCVFQLYVRVGKNQYILDVTGTEGKPNILDLSKVLKPGSVIRFPLDDFPIGPVGSVAAVDIKIVSIN